MSFLRLMVHRGTSLELLVNFKADAGQPATYYGDTYSDELVVKGKLPPDLRVETLIAFLAGVA